MDLCIEGSCKKNPFAQDLDRQPEEAEVVVTAAVCPYPKHAVPPAETVPDATVPQFNPTQTRFVDLSQPDSAGGKRGGKLSNEVLDERLATMHPQLMECIDLGACYSEQPLLGGDFEFQLQVAGTGQVVAASVITSEPLRLAPVLACARRSASNVQFPPFDGTMSVRYAVTIE